MGEQEATTRMEAFFRSSNSPTSDEKNLRRRLLEILLEPAEPRKMTYQEFLAWADEDTLAEWVDGEVVMKLARSGREPDLLFVAREHLDRLKDTYLDGPADLVVEIISPESVGRDRGEKYYEYAQGGVPEYWLIDPHMEWAEFYLLEGKRYRMAFSGKEGEYHASALPGFWLHVEWLWQEPLPSPIGTLAEIVGMDPSLAEAFERALAGG